MIKLLGTVPIGLRLIAQPGIKGVSASGGVGTFPLTTHSGLFLTLDASGRLLKRWSSDDIAAGIDVGINATIVRVTGGWLWPVAGKDEAVFSLGVGRGFF